MRTLILLMTLLVACNAPPSQEDLDSTRGGRIDVFFNEPGTRITNKWDPDLVDVLVDLIDSADATLDIAVMGFSKSEVIDALIRAYDRGVMVRMVGDAGHWYAPGYHAVLERHIPLVTGNLTHIMHDKFVVVDDRFVFCGTANFTTSDLTQNSNNVMLIDSPCSAASTSSPSRLRASESFTVSISRLQLVQLKCTHKRRHVKGESLSGMAQPGRDVAAASPCVRPAPAVESAARGRRL